MPSGPAVGRDFGHLVQDRPAIGRLGVELVPRHRPQQERHQHDQGRTRRHQPDGAPRCIGQDDGCDQHHGAAPAGM